MSDVLVSLLLVLIMGIAVVAWSDRYAGFDPQERSQIATLVGVAYALRMVIHFTVQRTVSLFTHGAGGDSGWYEVLSALIVQSWRTTGVRFVTSADMPELGNAALMSNLLAAVRLVVDGSPVVAGTGILAAASCITVTLLYRFARDFGTTRSDATWMANALLFTPSFVYYTSDTYKDALVLLFVTVNVVSAVRFAHDLRVRHLVAIALASIGLWYVRNYLVYACAAVPVIAFTFGLRSIAGRVIGALLLLAGMIALGSSPAVVEAWDAAEVLFDAGTSANALAGNAQGGSGVMTDASSPWAGFGTKLAYTVLSPFPWMSGSFALQLGKVDAIVFYAALLRVARSARFLIRFRLSVTASLLAFVLPAIVAYAATVSNIGLIVRQRMPIVALVVLLAAMGTSIRSREGGVAQR